MEEWLIGGLVNIYVGALFAVLGLRLTYKFMENRLTETFLLAIFFDLTGFTGLVVGIYELIYQVERTQFPLLLNAFLDLLVIIYIFVLLVFPIVLLEDTRFAVTYVVIILISFIIGYILNDPLVIRTSIIIIVFTGVAAIMFYIYTLNKSMKALTFSIGLIILGISLAIRPFPQFTIMSFALAIIGSTVIFIGQIISPIRRTSGSNWVSTLKNKVEIR